MLTACSIRFTCNSLYTIDEVKRVGDNVVGVVTQCVKSQNASKCNPATMANICLKINTKLGGINSIVDPRERFVFELMVEV